VISALLFVSVADAARAVAYVGETNDFATNTIGGWVQFDQDTDLGDVHVTGSISGFAPNSVHGFHVHATGDSRTPFSTTTLGSHFSIGTGDDATHGYPPNTVRHPGDMGNITADGNGMFTLDFMLGQGKMSLSNAQRSIIGRAVVIHGGADTGVQPTGASGTPFAFGKIGIANVGGNTAAPADGITAAISNHIGVNGQVAGGKLWITSFNGNITVYTDFTALPNGNYRLGFYQYGVLTNTTWNSGAAISTEAIMDITAQTPICQALHATSVKSFVGLMSVVWSSTGSAFSDIVSMGVVSIGNTGTAFTPMPTGECLQAASLTSGALHVQAAWGLVVLAVLAFFA